MDEFSLQKTHRFQGEQVVQEKGVGVFESTNNTSKRESTQGDRCIRDVQFIKAELQKTRRGLQVYLWASTRACEALSSV